jgi:hypothetical protein
MTYMGFPRKFKHLLEIERGDVPEPDFVILVYAVCATSRKGCGWGGWMIDGAFQGDPKIKDINIHPDKLSALPAVEEQICPMCGLITYRTGAWIRMVPSEDQTPYWLEGENVESLPISYEN